MLEGLPEECPRTRTGTTKILSLYKFDGPGSSGICGGVIARGTRFCIKRGHSCLYASHQVKGWDTRPVEVGVYIIDPVTMRAYLKPCLPITDAAWFCHREGGATGWGADNGNKDNHLLLPARQGTGCQVCRSSREEFGEDQGLLHFAMAMKMPGQLGFNPLNPPKHLRLDHDTLYKEDLVSSAQGWPWIHESPTLSTPSLWSRGNWDLTTQMLYM